MAGTFIVVALLGAEQRAIADGRCEFRLASAAARKLDEDFRRRAEFFFVPIGRDGDEFAIGRAARDVGEDDGRHLARLVNTAATAVDRALILELAEHRLEGDLRRPAADAEGAADIALADLAGLLSDEGRDLLF